ncbi:MAG TPA: WD40 repeat domain-containing protein [Verrucomicrobiae bacterium]|nr:WD40 repeat domain-containing protein [Verrucomicrobiae bacterium]
MSAHPFAASKRALRIRGVLITSAVIIAAVSSIFLYTRSRQSTLILQVPQEAITIKLNGVTTKAKPTKQGLRVPVIAGQYKLEVSRPKYLPFSQDIRIPVGETITVRPVFTLAPISALQNESATVSFVRPLPDDNLVFYVGDSGTRLYRLETTTQSQVAVSERSISPIRDVQWPISGDVAMVTRNDGVYLLEMPKFDFRTQRFDKVAELEVVSPVWDPNDDRVAAALMRANGERSLILSDKRFTTMERKADMTGFTNPKVVWSPGSRFIAVLNQSVDASQNNVWIYNLVNGNFVPATDTGNVRSVSFSPDERTLLLERDNLALSLRDLATGKETAIATAGTVATAAWKTSNTFYLPEPTSNSLIQYNLQGNSRKIPYTLPSTSPVQGMFYFERSDSLVFYTEKAVYTVSMAE